MNASIDRNRQNKNPPIRVFVLTEQPLIAEMVRLTLNHGVFETYVAKQAEDAWSVIRAWHPQLAMSTWTPGVINSFAKLPRIRGQTHRLPILP